METILKLEITRVKWPNAVGLILLPFVTAVLIPWYAIQHGIGAAEVIALIMLWCMTGIAISAGYHRLFAHHSWKAPAPVRLLLLILGAGALHNSVIAWVQDHRQHHLHTDKDEDPYNVTRGFWYSHMGWALLKDRKGDMKVPDLWKDPLCRWQHDNYLLIAIGFNLLIPICLGLLAHNVPGMILFAGLLRIVMFHQFGFFVNSACHMWGTRRWDKSLSARDNLMVAIIDFGEGYHNSHHAHVTDYRAGRRWHHFDPTKWFIWTLSKVGLARDLRKIPDRNSGQGIQAEK